jgi:hypothetical protein
LEGFVYSSIHKLQPLSIPYRHCKYKYCTTR